MTEAPEPAPARPGTLAKLAPYAAPALVFLAVVVHFLRFHEYSLLLPESLILMGGAVVIGATIGALGRLRPETLAPALMALTLGVFLCYRPEIISSILGVAKAVVDDAALALGLAGLVVFLALVTISWLLRRHLDTIVVAVFGTIVVTGLVLPTVKGGEPVETGSLPAKLKDLPPVIHIVLDEHIGLAGLPPEMPESAPAARAVEATYEDFALFSHAHSGYSETEFSLASLFNHDIQDDGDMWAALEPRAAGYTLKQSNWFDQLKNEGYALRVYQSDWLDMCSRIASVDACYTYPLYSPNAVQRSSLGTLARLKALLGRLYIGPAHQLPSPVASMEALKRFQSDIAETPRGVAYVVHLLLPHDGYLYTRDCTLADPSEWGEAERSHSISAETRAELYRHYLPQLMCASVAIEGVLNELKQLGVYDEATIIVHGDHGSRIGEHAYRETSEPMTQQDLLDHFSTLFATKAPGIAPGVRAESMSLQRTFAKMFLDGGPRSAPNDIVRTWDEDAHAFVELTFSWPDSPKTPGDAEQVSARTLLRQSVE